MRKFIVTQNDTGAVLQTYFSDGMLPAQDAWGLPGSYTQTEVDATYDNALLECHLNRMREYPLVSDFADAMVHANAGDSTQLSQYYAACEAVKARYPKPVPPS